MCGERLVVVAVVIVIIGGGVVGRGGELEDERHGDLAEALELGVRDAGGADGRLGCGRAGLLEAVDEEADVAAPGEGGGWVVVGLLDGGEGGCEGGDGGEGGGEGWDGAGGGEGGGM